jgi:hypothetical protein
MANVDIRLGYKDSTWFTANATLVLKVGQMVYLQQTGTYKIGDGVTQLSALSFLGGSSITKTSDLINDGDDGTSHFISLEDLPSTLALYPTTAASGIGGYNKLVSSITDLDYNTTAVDVSTGAITGTDQLIAGLITDANQIIGNPGIFNMTTIGNIRKTSGSGQAEFFFRVYKRDAGGAETLILQSNNTQQITSAIYAEFFTSGLWNDGVFISTDRIVIKFYGTKVGSGSNPTYDFQFGGTAPIRSLVPIPLTVVPVLKLDNLQDVDATTPNNNDVLTYESSTSLWKNKQIDNIFTVQFETAPLSPADATTYYFGDVRITPNLTATNFNYNLGSAYTIIGARISIGSNTSSGTTELATLQIRNITQGTSSSLGTFRTDATSTSIKGTTFTGASISVAASDDIVAQIDFPTYATNPTTILIFLTLICKK